MDANTLLTMAAFALVTSITPGPVNLLALHAGARHGLRGSLLYVTGATAGFTLLLVLVGLGVQGLAAALPALTRAIRWGGLAFLLWMAWQLVSAPIAPAAHDAPADASAARPSFLAGAALQWLNPKAWLASLASMAAYAPQGGAVAWSFAALYFAICWGSIAAWAGAGRLLAAALRRPRTRRAFNVAMAALLAGTAVLMVAA